MSGIKIRGTGRFAPAKIVTNDDLAKIVDTSDEWITTRTGIQTRHHCTTETHTDMCVGAARQALENAGLAAYAQLRARLPQGGALLIVCGKGNNGGDGLVMARAAAKDGWRVVVLLAEGDPKTPDAMTNYARLADLPVTKCRDAAALAAQPFDAVVDALYGTGFHGSLRPAGLAACALMNRQRESGTFVLAVDLPSGINTDTGEAAEGAVRADLTVTFDSCKPLHTAPSSAPFCGEIVCADIGIRDEWHPAGLAQL